MINKHQTGKNVKKTRSYPYLSSFHIKIAAQKPSMNSMRFEMFSIDVTLKFYPANQACGLF